MGAPYVGGPSQVGCASSFLRASSATFIYRKAFCRLARSRFTKERSLSKVSNLMRLVQFVHELRPLFDKWLQLGVHRVFGCFCAKRFEGVLRKRVTAGLSKS